MKRIRILSGAVIVLFLAFAAGRAFSASVDMEEGEWETTVETTMKMEGISMPPRVSKVRDCLTRKDLVPSSGDKNCKVTKMKAVGNKVFWSIVCVDGKSKTEGEGEATYEGSSYKGTTRMKMVEDGESMTLLMKLSGRRVGACTGKKAGATSKETEKYQAMADKAKAEGDAAMAKLRTPSKQGAEILKAPIPLEEKGACVQEGFPLTPECEVKVGAAFNFQPGSYEIVVAKIGKTGEFYSSVEEKKEVLCLGMSEPVPLAVLPADRSGEVKRGREKITWNRKESGVSEQGGIFYKGNSFEGVVHHTMDAGAGAQSFKATRITGRRLGDGNCLGGMDYSAKAREETVVDRSKNLMKNPVKGLRNLLGY